MIALRVVVGLLLAAAAVCLVLAIVTGKPGYRRWGIAIFKWTVVAALGFFAMLVFQTLA